MKTSHMKVTVKKVKEEIKMFAKMNTSSGVFTELDAHISELLVKASKHAADDGRITVMSKDIKHAIQTYNRE